jgi:hypothetical protein
MPQERRQNALSSVVNAWTRTDPAGAAEWMQTLPTGKERDSMVSTFAQQVVQGDPEGALAWAATLSDERQRENRIQQLASQEYVKAIDAAVVDVLDHSVSTL